MMHTRLLHLLRLAPALALLGFASAAHAQTAVSLTTLTPYTENFDDLNTAFPSGTYANNGATTTSFGGAFPAISNANAATQSPIVPVLIQPGLTVAYPITNVTDFNLGGALLVTGGAPTTVNSLRALRDGNAAGNSSEFSFGGKLGNTVTLTGQFTNNTGADISGWNVAYNIERYSTYKSLTPTTVAFSYSANGTTYTPAGTDYSFTGDGVTAGVFLGTVVTSPFSQTVPLIVSASSSIFFRWTFVDPGTDGRHIALDDLVITPSAIPEPSTCAAATGLGVLVLVLSRRRRRSTAPADCNL